MKRTGRRLRFFTIHSPAAGLANFYSSSRRSVKPAWGRNWSRFSSHL